MIDLLQYSRLLSDQNVIIQNHQSPQTIGGSEKMPSKVRTKKCRCFLFLFALLLPMIGASKELEPRIIKGYECDITAYPFLVSLPQITGFFCGGTIITLDWVLTTAHCVDMGMVKQKLMRVVAGSNYRIGFGLNITEEGLHQVRTVKEAKLHENFVEAKQEDAPEFDLAVLKMNRSFELSSNVKPALLPYKGFTQHCLYTVAAGWGRTTEDRHFLTNNQTDSLIAGMLPLRCGRLKIEMSKCEKTFRNFGEWNICAVKSTGPRGGQTCKGDTGGPLLCESNVACVDGGVSHIVVGITAKSDFECSLTQAVVFMRVEFWMNWIRRMGIDFPRGTGPGGKGMEGFKDFVASGVVFRSFFLMNVVSLVLFTIW